MNKKTILLFDIDGVLTDANKLRPYLDGWHPGIWHKLSLPYKESLYPEVLEVLEQLKNAGFRLGIFSQADNIKYQKKKIASAMAIFDPQVIYISKNNKSGLLPEIASQYGEETIWFIDDRPEILAAAKKIIPRSTTVRVRRGKYDRLENPVSFPPDYEVFNILDLVKLLFNA